MTFSIVFAVVPEHINRLCVFRHSIITKKGSDEEEMKARIDVAGIAFNNLKRVFKDKKISRNLRLRILMCYV